MKETGRILPMKALAALCLLLGFAPVCLLLGRSFLPDKPLLWYILPVFSVLWGTTGYCLAGKKRMGFLALGFVLLVGFGCVYLLPGGWTRLFPLAPCFLLLILLPPAWARPLGEEWPLGAWAVGVAFYLAAQFLAGRPQWSGISEALALCFPVYLFLMVMMLNRQSLREGMHGTQKAPAALRRRNHLLVLALFIPALLASCWGILGRWLDRAWNGLRQAIAWLAEAFLSLFAREEAPVQPQSGGGEGMGRLPGAENAEPGFLALLMEKLFTVLAYALVAAAAVFLCVFLAKRLRRFMKRLLVRFRQYAAAAGEEYVDEAESTLNLDEKARALRKRVQKVLARPAREPAWNELDARARVRRLYRQFLERTPDAKTLTAREALTREKRLEAGTAAAFAELYERARYSDHEISAQEADRMRQNVK